MAHEAQKRYANMVLAKLRATLVTRDQFIFNSNFEGDPTAGMVKVPVRDTEVSVRDYDKAKGIDLEEGSTTYMDLPIDNDKAVNEIIDGFDAASVPDGIIVERLDSAGYSMGLSIDKESIGLLETGGTVIGDTAASTKANILTKIVDARTALSKANVPADMRYLIVSPEIYGLLLLSEEFIKAGDLSQELVAAGVIGRIAGFNVFESNNLAEGTEFIAGHPGWSHRVMEWAVPVKLQDLGGSGKFIGASAVQGRLVYGQMISRALTVQVKTKAVDIDVAISSVTQVGGTSGSVDSTGIKFTFDKNVTGLEASHITLTNGTGSATKGTLSGSNKEWTLAISNPSEGKVTVKISGLTGYKFPTTTSEVDIYAAPAGG
ncbi:MAG: hypothetical protein ACOX3H_06820 [Saccharofermentanales bacterium]|jgi:hypothetical protein